MLQKQKNMPPAQSQSRISSGLLCLHFSLLTSSLRPIQLVFIRTMRDQLAKRITRWNGFSLPLRRRAAIPLSVRICRPLETRSRMKSETETQIRKCVFVAGLDPGNDSRWFRLCCRQSTITIRNARFAHEFYWWGLPERSLRMKQPRLCRNNRDADRFCCFSNRTFLQVLDLDNLPEIWAQSFDCFFQHFFLFKLGELAFRSQRMIRNFADGFATGKSVSTFRSHGEKRSPLAQNHQRRIDRNAGEPGGEARSAIEVAYVNISTKQSILNSIFRVFAI